MVESPVTAFVWCYLGRSNGTLPFEAGCSVDKDSVCRWRDLRIAYRLWDNPDIRTRILDHTLHCPNSFPCRLGQETPKHILFGGHLPGTDFIRTRRTHSRDRTFLEQTNTLFSTTECPPEHSLVLLPHFLADISSSNHTSIPLLSSAPSLTLR